VKAGERASGNVSTCLAMLGSARPSGEGEIGTVCTDFPGIARQAIPIRASQQLLRPVTSWPNPPTWSITWGGTCGRRNLRQADREDLWTADQLSLLGNMPDAQVARRTGRTVSAVRIKRQKLGIPNRHDGRRRATGGS
jgi:hypothetical protein